MTRKFKMMLSDDTIKRLIDENKLIELTLPDTDAHALWQAVQRGGPNQPIRD